MGKWSHSTMHVFKIDWFNGRKTDMCLSVTVFERSYIGNLNFIQAVFLMFNNN